MKLATIRTADGTVAVRIDGSDATEIPGFTDVGALLAAPDWRHLAAAGSGARHPVDALDFAPLIVRPDKIVCVGLNYRSHILETGGVLPDYPTLFAKFRSSLIGAGDPIVKPAVSKYVDWEAELAVIIGSPVRHANEEQAIAAIAGYSVLNDVSARDWQRRTDEWLQGKTFEATTPLGPVLATSDEMPGTSGEIACEVNGDLMQKSDISDLLFGPAALVSYISTIFTLLPGDVIATGTPGGIGAAQKPPRFLSPGDVVVTRIDGIGELRNTVRTD